MSFANWFKGVLSPAKVKEQQSNSPKIALLHREFAEHPSKGITPVKLASIFADAEQGSMTAQAELFMDMQEKDAHISAELSKRIMAVKKLDWTLEPPRNATATEKKNTRLLEDLIRDDIDTGEVRKDMLDAIGHGYSCLELGWGRNAQGLWVPSQIEHREPSWFTCPPDDRNTLHLRDYSSSYGVPLQPFGWIPHIHKARSGYIPRSGLLRVLAWPYLYKNYSVRDLAEFLEIYGLPIRVGKYSPTASPTEKRDLLKTVLSIGHNAAGIIPDSMQLELQQVMASGNADAFMAMIKYCDGLQSKAILGGTLTSGTAANGNRSLGDIHNEVRLDIRDDDAKQVDQSLSSYLVYPIAMLNGLFNDNRCPRWVSDTQEPDDLALYADALPKLAAAGARIPLSYVNFKLKIPIPEEDEPILQAASSGIPMPTIQPAATALAGEVKLTPVVVPFDVVQADLLSNAAAPVIDQWLLSIRALLNASDSMESFRESLLSSYGNLDTTELSNVMGLALAAAELSGRFDVREET